MEYELTHVTATYTVSLWWGASPKSLGSPDCDAEVFGYKLHFKLFGAAVHCHPTVWPDALLMVWVPLQVLLLTLKSAMPVIVKGAPGTGVTVGWGVSVGVGCAVLVGVAVAAPVVVDLGMAVASAVAVAAAPGVCCAMDVASDCASAVTVASGTPAFPPGGNVAGPG
jgi:hypothetical protein